MPELDGVQATAAIRELPGGREIPIVALTANAMRQDVDRCLAGEMDDFVAKPVDRRQLFEALARHLPAEAEATQPSASSPAARERSSRVIGIRSGTAFSKRCKGSIARAAP